MAWKVNIEKEREESSESVRDGLASLGEKVKVKTVHCCQSFCGFLPLARIATKYTTNF